MTEEADSARREEELEALGAEVARLKRLVELATLLNATPSLDDLLVLILDAARELLQAEESTLMLLDESTNELVFEIASGTSAADVAKQRIPAEAGVAGWTLKHGQPVVVDDPATDERFYRDVDRTTGLDTRNLLAVPLMVKGDCIGVVEALNKIGTRGFDERDVETATALAALAAVAVDNARLYASLTEAVVNARLLTQPVVVQGGR